MNIGGIIHMFAGRGRRTTPTGEFEALPIEAGPSVAPAIIPSRRLDFLRGAAAVYVVIGHARGHLFAGGALLTERGGLEWFDYVILALLQFTSMGTEAVILFFVMSGFAMAHSFSRSESTVSFYKKRAIRIWPPYLFAVALAFFIAGIILRSPVANAITAAVSADDWGIHRAATMAVYGKVDTELTAQFWSLPQEVIFYLLCPLLLTSRKRIMAMWIVAAILTATGALFFGGYPDPTVGGGVVYRHFFMLLIFFMTGAVAYHWQHLIPRISGRTLFIIFIVAFISIWFVKIRIFGGWNLLSSLMTAPIAILLIGSVPASLYDRKWLNWGHFSYSLYIFHMQVVILMSYVLARVWGLEQPEMNSYWMWALAVPPTIVMSWVLYLVVEKRCDAALSRIRNRERAAKLHRSVL